jgi:DNA-binding transcriptional MerR regulator
MQAEPPLHSGGPWCEPAPRGKTFKIHDVSALLAVPAPTIRSWERRHALPTVTRDEHGHRRYTQDDVAVLRRIRDRRAAGVKVDEAVAAATAPSPPALCQRLLTAIDQLDADGTTAVLDLSLDAHGLPVTIDEVLLPSMREVGARWSRGQCDVAQEHLATSNVLAWLTRRGSQAPPPLDERPIVLSCGPADQHTISLEAFAALLRRERFACLDLGAQTPAAALRHAVERTSAQAVVVVSQLPRNRAAAVTALRAVADTEVALFYAGAAFRTTASRQKLPGHYLGGNLSQAAATMTAHLRPHP